ncbi:MAG: putative phage repressor [Patescibacteria group bacterium]|nr:putative phage repressor [Patescibacteria group bacterium]
MKLWPLGLYRVAGESMLPAFRPGDTLLGWRWFRPRAGQAVVARQAGRPIIKRIARLEGERVFLAGDNPPHSTDSRHFGAVSRAQIEAKIIRKI